MQAFVCDRCGNTVKPPSMQETVDVGAFKCPRWFAEGLMILISLEGLAQGKLKGRREEIEKESDDWLVENGFGPIRKRAEQ